MTENYKSILIGGVGRSGTSITREFLGVTDNALTFPFEYRFIIDPDGVIDFLNDYDSFSSPFAYSLKIERLETFLFRLSKNTNTFSHFLGKTIRKSQRLRQKITANSYHGWHLDEHLPLFTKQSEALISTLKKNSYRGSWVGTQSFKTNSCIYFCEYSKDELYTIFRSFLSSLFIAKLKAEKKQVLVEDNTWNLFHCVELEKIFDSPKFVHVYRDPRDIICSYVKQRWMPKNFEQAAAICRKSFLKIFAETAKIKEVKNVKLEDLVKNDSVKQSLLEFAGLEPNDRTESFPFSEKSFGRWKSEINETQLKSLEPIIKDVTEHLGYNW